MRTIYKYILLLSVVISTIAFTSCESDAAFSSIAECTWYHSENGDQNDMYTLYLAEGKYISFMDCSIGYLSHRWEVSEVGTIFLEGEMDWGQTDYSNLITYDIPHVNDLTTIHVYFTEAGTHSVRLYNTFAEQVYYPYSEWNSTTGSSDYFVKEAEYIDGVYVFDQTWTVEVYDSTLAPSAEVYYDKDCTQPVDMGVLTPAVYAIDGTTVLTAATYKEVEIEYGDTLYFKDTSYDRPNTWTWTCTAMGYSYNYTGYTNQGNVIPITFQQLTYAPSVGIETDPFTMRLQVIRETPETLSESKNIPTASQVTADIPLDIKVVPTTKALEYTAQQTSQTTIELTLSNSEFLETATFDASNYRVGWSNDYEGAVHMEGVITPTSVALTSDLKVIEITLSGADDDNMIYNTDDITVYMAEGTSDPIALFDGSDFVMETPVSVYTTFCEMIWEEDFETEGGEERGWKAILPTSGSFTDMVDGYNSDGEWVDCNDAYAPNMNEYADSYPDAGVDRNDGHSLRVDGQLYDGNAPYYNNQCITLVSPTFTNPLVTTIRLTFKTYLPNAEEGNTQGFSPTFNLESDAQSQSSTNGWCTMTLTGANSYGTGGWLASSVLSIGLWAEHSLDIKPNDLETVYDDLMLTMRTNGYKGVVYFDDITFGSIEERPRP